MTTDRELLALAHKKHLELAEEINRLNIENSFLKNQPMIAREAISRFVAPDMYPAAMDWLRERATANPQAQTL